MGLAGLLWADSLVSDALCVDPVVWSCPPSAERDPGECCPPGAWPGLTAGPGAVAVPGISAVDEGNRCFLAAPAAARALVGVAGPAVVRVAGAMPARGACCVVGPDVVRV